MRNIVAGVDSRGATDQDVAYLAMALGTSGTVLRSAPENRSADLASTGGPASLSTILGPIYLRALGYNVPKLGVPGRPAGGVDTLSRIPGYRVTMSDGELANCLQTCGYVHFLAGQSYAPLDACLFEYRRKSGSPPAPELAIASLLAKKVAVGLELAGLDIRVAAHGNLGSTWEAARDNARRFRRVAAICGLTASCFLTDAGAPYQPFVGRGEALVAIGELFRGVATGTLGEHALLCLRMAARTVDHGVPDAAQITSKAKDCFFANIRAQGATLDAFEEYTAKIREGHRFHVCARNSGVLAVRLERLRDLILAFQPHGPLGEGAFPDGMGVILRARSGTVVRRGQAVATVRVSENCWPAVQRRMENVVTTDGRRTAVRDLEEVS